MSAACRCQGCGDLLPQPDAICPRCDAALSTPPADTGRFVCPHCQGRFSQLAEVPWPPQVPWWRPTTLQLQCPHCHTPLRDRFASPPSRWLVAFAIAAAVASQLYTTGWTRLLLGLAILGAVYAPLAWAVWRHRAHRNDPHRFVPGTTRLWAQGNDRLRRPSAF
jgi:hypothetical protein